MALKQKRDEPLSDKKKRKRVGFADFDVGKEANECIRIFIASSPEEVDAADSLCIEPVDLNHFFGENGKIYGYKDLKINIWLSSISFHAYVDITFQSTSDGCKGITDLGSVFQNIFGESLVAKKDDFLKTFSTESHYIRTVISNGEVVYCQASKEHDNTQSNYLEPKTSTLEHQVIRMDLSTMPVGLLYSRLVPLVLLLVEGSRPVDITDPRWEIYFVVKKETDQSGDIYVKLLGFTTIYRFYRYPENSRLRMSQILVLPPYQGQGHGRLLLETLNSIAVSENVYDVTIEEPSDYLQHVRTCIDTLRLLAFTPIKPIIDSVASHLKHSNQSKKICESRFDPPASMVVEDVRKKLKINKKQFLRCWDILIYLNLDPKDAQCMENYRAFVSDRTKADIFDKDNGTIGKFLFDIPNDYDHDMTFVVFRSQTSGKLAGLDSEVDGNQMSQEEQLAQLVDEKMEEIAEVAQKVSLHRKP